MNYREYRDARQAEINALPLFWAFSNEQFLEAMKKRGYKPRKDTKPSYYADEVCSIGGGGYFLKRDKEIINEFFSKPDPLDELMKDPEFAEDAFYYEMGNHEYHINYYQGDWDVCSCFGHVEYNDADDRTEYFKQLGWEQQTIDAYERARKRFLKAADENGWY